MLIGIPCSIAAVCHVSSVIPANGFYRGMVGIRSGCFCCQLGTTIGNLKAIPPSTPVQTALAAELPGTSRDSKLN